MQYYNITSALRA